MKTKTINIGLEKGAKKESVKQLVKLLADLHVLYVKTRNFHWNVTGPRFLSLHEFFEEQYNALAERIDEVAERIRALGEVAPGSMKEFLSAARLKEVAGTFSENEMIAMLLADREAVIRFEREAAGKVAGHDDGTNDFLVGMIEGDEKTAWMLRSYLE